MCTNKDPNPEIFVVMATDQFNFFNHLEQNRSVRYNRWLYFFPKIKKDLL